MERLIDAHELGNKGFVVFKQACDAAPNEEVFKAVQKMGGEFEELIKNAPTIDAAPVVHGRWIVDESGVIICSECGAEHEWLDYRASFCEDCGAKMDLKEADHDPG